MSYEDFGKCAIEALEDDFDTEHSLTVKTTAPYGWGLSTKTAYKPGMSVFPNQLTMNWAHPSGFSLDKVEMSSCDKVNVEASLTKFVPGLKFEFKGIDSVGTVGVAYDHKLATVAADLDIGQFSTLRASAMGHSRGILAGGCAELSLNKFELKDYSLGVAWAPQDGTFAGIRANNKFSEFNGSLHYRVKPNVAISSLVDFDPKAGKNGIKATLGAEVGLCSGCSVKGKANTEGVINASVRKEFPNNLSVIGAASVDVRNLKGFNFGVAATLG